MIAVPNLSFLNPIFSGFKFSGFPGNLNLTFKMLSKKHFAAEPQFLCDVCSEAVTNPICPSCLTIEIQAWLTHYPGLKNEIMPLLHKYLKDIDDKINESTKCIICKDKKAASCPYCFTEYVLRQLRKINANKIILKEFIEFFNFDLHHTGYTKGAEELGLI